MSMLSSFQSLPMIVDSFNAELKQMYKESIVILEEMSKFEPEWDGYRGKIFPKQNIEAFQELITQALTFFYNHSIVPDGIHIGPCSDGSIDLEVLVGSKYMCLEFDNPSSNILVYTHIEKQDKTSSTYTASNFNLENVFKFFL